MRKFILCLEDWAENPAKECDARVVSFSRRHTSFDHPDGWYDGDRRPRTMGGYRRQLKAGTAFELSYFEHGNCVWSLRGEGPQCRWDSVGLAGILFLPDYVKESHKTYAKREEWARNFLEYYTDWCNGEVYIMFEEIDGDLDDPYSVSGCDVDTVARERAGGDEFELVWR